MPDPTGAEAPRVTAVVVCFNQAAFVRQALDSVAAQALATRLVIVDDASTDGSQRLITEWLDQHSVDADLVFHDVNQGVSRSCNDGAHAVSTEYMAFLAADDYWLAGKLDRQLRLLEALPDDYGMVYSDALLCDKRGRILPGSCIEHQSRRRAGDRPQGWVFGELMRGNFIPAPAVLLKTAAVSACGGFDNSLAVEDLDFWLRLSQHFRVAYDPECAAVYRIRPGSMVRTREVAIRFEDMRVYRRYLDGPRHDLAIAALSRGFYRLYAAGAEVGPRFLWLSLRLRPHWQPALLLPLALLGLNGRRYKRFRRQINRVFPMLRSFDL